MQHIPAPGICTGFPPPLPSSTDNDKKQGIWQKARGLVLEETEYVSG